MEFSEEAGGIVKTLLTEELDGYKTLKQNHRAIVGMLRKGVEMLHGALKQVTISNPLLGKFYVLNYTGQVITPCCKA